MRSALSWLLPDRLRLLFERGGRPLRFAVAGGMNTVFGFFIYPALRLALPQVHYMAALGIAQALSLCFAYLSYKVLAFRGRRGNVLRQIGTFSSFYLCAIAVNWLALPIMVRLLHLPPVLAQTGFTLCLIPASYFWHSRVTFRSTGASS